MLCCLLAFLNVAYLFSLPPTALALECLAGPKEQGGLDIFGRMTEWSIHGGRSEVKGDFFTVNKTVVIS